MNAESSLLILLLLGALHGVNPAMGWLFAVSLGLQEERRSVVWRAFGPLALGHGLSMGVTVGAAALLGVALPPDLLRWVVGGALVGMGVLQLARHWHPRLGGMRVGARDLVLWSFLMATAHGAGLMALPFVLRGGDAGLAHAAGGHHHATAGSATSAAVDLWGLLGTVVHTAGYLAAAALVAVLVYEKLGVGILRRAWLNVNLIWAGALIVTGVGAVLLG